MIGLRGYSNASSTWAQRKRKHIEEEEVIDEGSASGSSYAQIGGEAGPKGSDSSDFVPIATLSSRKRRKTSTDKTPVVSVRRRIRKERMRLKLVKT